MTKRTVIIVFLIVLFGSCSKSSDPALTKEQLLSQSRGWIMTAIAIQPEIFGTPDFFSVLKTCIQDDLVFFNTNGMYRKEEGATKCSPADPKVWEEGTWAFNTDKSILTETSSTGGALEYKVIGLTASELKLSLEQTIDSVNYTFVFTSAVVK